jgi:Fe2+ transport system protein B
MPIYFYNRCYPGFAFQPCFFIFRFGNKDKTEPAFASLRWAQEQENTIFSFLVLYPSQARQSSGGHGALAAYAFLVFVLLYTPCMVTAAAQKQEFGVKWMWASIIGQLAIAWLAALVVFQGGRLLGAG